MGVYIPNMEMPTSCGYCPFKYRTMEGDECMFNARSTEYQKRPDDCPLVPVPPHGRLIDADALEEHDGWIRDSKYFSKQSSHTHIQFVFANDIIDAPTIIPAIEEGE